MRAWLLKDFSGIGALTLTETQAIPEPGEGQIRLRVRCAALNPADRFLAEKLYPARPPLPHILGRDGCGTVNAIGAGVTGFRLGDRVVLLRGDAGIERPGTFAEYVVVPAEVVAPAPAEWSDEQAAAAPLVYETAHQAITQWEIREPTTVLITGASGGVGIASVHLAKAFGHRVIGLSRSEGKRQAIRKFGCDLSLDTQASDLKHQVKSFTNGAGVGLVVDNVGGPLFANVIDCLGYGGRVSVVGMLDGPVPSFNTARLLFKRVRIGGVQVGDYGPQQAQNAWKEIVDGLNRIGQRPVVDRLFPMEQLVDAFHHLESGPLGKLLLDLR